MSTESKRFYSAPSLCRHLLKTRSVNSEEEAILSECSDYDTYASLQDFQEDCKLYQQKRDDLEFDIDLLYF